MLAVLLPAEQAWFVLPLIRRTPEDKRLLLPYPNAVCVPVHPNKAAADSVVLPECRVLSVLYSGEYSGIDEAWLALGREAKARGLKPVAPPRVLGIVAQYTGREIDTSRYCSRIVLPVEE